MKVQDPDTNYVRKLLEKASELRFRNSDSSLVFSRKAVEISEELDYVDGLAEGLKAIGLVESDRGNFFMADDYFKRSLSIYEHSGDTLGMSNLLNNLGSVYQTQGYAPKALDYFIRSLRYAQIVEDPLRIGTAYVNLGTIYTNDKSTYDQAIENYKKALPFFDQIDYSIGLAVGKINIGEMYLKKDNPEASLLFLKGSLEAFQELGLDPSTPLNFLGEAHFKLEDYKKAEEYYRQGLDSASYYGTFSEEVRANIGLGKSYIELGSTNNAIEYFNDALKIINENQMLSQKAEALLGMSTAYTLLNDYRNALFAKDKYVQVRDSISKLDYGEFRKTLSTITELKEREYLNQYENQRIQYELERDLEREKDQQAKLFLYIGLGLLVLVILGLINRFLFIRKAKNQIAKEKDRSDEILLNILPEETAKELKANGRIKAKQFQQITVLFTDFKGFSVIAESISPEKLVDSVDYYFRYFDAIVEKHGLEKIKTIGDAYMCAGGIPKQNETHAEDAMKAAIEIRDFVEETKQNPPPNIHPFEIRIGLNSGPVVAGVVGTKKFAYDIWGSTVNFAARMESKSEPGRINVSESSYQLLKDKYDFTYRGELEVKNGQVLQMYFAEIESKVTI
ncbi:adenylate/guanylate cyclase domain-containing protein [Robiginitalea sp. M39]|uniref:Adenylate/guanylate cyclase domain-containing protein n=2 Tax=Robiginitalea aurantiaca TaxID=3056915 RepID=A0ABT7WID7_9FLAO|nr:adenylate/guanylate cyclase domain-containing protein [Robiginitalea aurantiaca]